MRDFFCPYLKINLLYIADKMLILLPIDYISYG
jgi:hypothetical protein